MCDAFVELGPAIRPSTVPPTTWAPFFRRARRIRFGSKRSGREETLSKVEYAPLFALASRICSRPPDALACGRVGCAKRRSRSTVFGVAGAGSGELAATRAFLPVAATWALALPAEAAFAVCFVFSAVAVLAGALT